MKKIIKKKLLFVIPSLELGGAEKSLVNLLNEIDYNRYDVDLFLFYKQGGFLSTVPKEVTFLENTKDFKIFSKTLLVSFFTFIFNGQIIKALYRLIFAINSRLIKDNTSEQINWKYVRFFLPNFKKKYDTAIGYLEKSSYYFVADNVLSHNKIGWIHTDLEALNLDFEFEKKYFKKLNHIVIVSDGLKERLSKKIPEINNKIKVIENINSASFIKNSANLECKIQFSKEDFNLIFVGRLVKEKGLFLAIDAIGILSKKINNIKLYLVGKGNLEVELKEYVKKNHLQNHVVFLGIQTNPYPLLKQADVFLMTSFYEGKSIALEEAKILNKAIVITNFSSATDQIIDNVTGLIVEMNAEAIANKIDLLYSKEAAESLSKNLANEKQGNEEEIKKLYQLINE
jgi:glycosyltransferase involved in cell wall biosynthesis